jgi:hypothetical protein
MPITYTNRKDIKYYLCKGLTKTGKPRYYFSREQKGEPVDEIPQGFEVEESVNGIVSLIKFRPKLISYEESACVEDALEKHPKARNYRVAVKHDQIIIYENTRGDMDHFFDVFNFLGLDREKLKSHLQNNMDRYAQFTPVMRFILDDQETREYRAQRWCYRGRIEDWMFVGPGKMKMLARKLIPTLGTDDFFELF